MRLQAEVPTHRINKSRRGKPGGIFNNNVKIQLNREQEAAFSPLFPVKNTT